MKILIPLFIMPLLLQWSISFGNSPDKSECLEGTIKYLLSYVKGSDCTFIRNNREYTAEEATGHIQRKYKHFKSKIKTPEDFIRLSATKSLITGKPYMVKTKSGKLMTSEDWLLEVLEDFRRQRQRNR